MALWSLSTQIHNIFTNYHATIPSNDRHNNSLFVLQVFTLYKASKNAILIWLLSLLRICSYLQELCYWYVTALQFLHTFQILEKKIPNYWFSPLVTILLLAHTSIHALIIVISIVVLLLAEVLFTPKST